jgi:hypothetical protein
VVEASAVEELGDDDEVAEVGAAVEGRDREKDWPMMVMV